MVGKELMLKNQFKITVPLAAFWCVLGVAIALVANVCLALWICVFAAAIYGLYVADTKIIWQCISLTPGCELLGRLSYAKAVPAETGKYWLFFCVFLLGVSRLYNKKNQHRSQHIAGILILILLFPSIIYSAFATEFELQSWILNESGVLQMGLLLLLAADEQWAEYDYFKVLKISILPMFSVLVYLALKTPKFNEIDFSNTANFYTTGNFGPNQVSTCLGFLLFLLVALLILKKPALPYLALNIIAIGFTFFRGIITFSRGGILVAVLGIVATLLTYIFKDKKAISKKYIIYIVFSMIVFATAIFAINSATKNALFARFTGTSATGSAEQEKVDINKLTANRYIIVASDLRMFAENPIMGVGIGRSKFLRRRYGGFEIVAHTEYSRLLSEQGLSGLAVILILTFFPIIWVIRTKDPRMKAIVLGLYIVGIGNTFHAATRTTVSTICVVFASIPVVVRRQENEKVLKLKPSAGVS